jgi:hypothetical protein
MQPLYFNLGQPLIAGALRESLELTGRILPHHLIASNFGLCAKINSELTLKAPDWLYVATVKQPGLPRQSYTPHLEGDVPTGYAGGMRRKRCCLGPWSLLAKSGKRLSRSGNAPIASQNSCEHRGLTQTR